MNKKLLCAALLAGLGVAQAASAQDFDDRWYLTGSVGVNVQDNDRNTDDAPFGAIGLGKFISPNWSVDGELNYQNPGLTKNPNLNWSQYGISLDLRRHFWLTDRKWHPYVVAGLGYQRSEEEYVVNAPDSPHQREEGNFAAKLGGGLQTDVGRVGVRAELAYRIDFDDSAVGPSYDGSIDDADSFGDLLASVGVVIPLGAKAVPPPPPAPPAPPAPAPAPEQPAPVTIDLNGVNFNFDKATLRPDAVAILNEAVEILKRYPEIRVEVAGHTDQCGKDAYNQGLSERRAKAVYDYLTSNGIDAGRLAGPVGYGESRPLEDLGQAMPGCKSEKNRRTELNVQN